MKNRLEGAPKFVKGAGNGIDVKFRCPRDLEKDLREIASVNGVTLGALLRFWLVRDVEFYDRAKDLYTPLEALPLLPPKD